MHSLTLVTVDVPKCTSDKTVNQMIDEDMKYLKELENPTPLFILMHLEELMAINNDFAGLVISAINDKLAPYSECTEEQEYLEFEDHTEELREEYENGTVDCFKLPNGSIISSTSCQGWDYTIHDDNTVYQRSYGKLKQEKRSKRAKRIKAIRNYPYKKLYKTFEQFAEEGRYMTYYKEYGGYGYIYNPNAFYDWYAIGGRWPQVFLVKENCTEFVDVSSFDDSACRKTAPKGYRWVCAARKKDIQWKAMYKYEKAKAEKSYNMFKTAFEARKLPDGVYGNITDNGIVGFGDPYYIKDETFPQYLARNRIIRKYKYPFISHAILDGDEYSENEYWVGDRNKTDRAWHKKICRFIDSLDDDTVIVGVDCHI